jgi:class 3 adenylate cyclase
MAKKGTRRIVNTPPIGTSTEYAFLYVDMSGHSELVERYSQQFAPVRIELRKLFEQKVKEYRGFCHPWQGDGGIAVFWQGDRFAQDATLAGLSVLIDMYKFHVEFNDFPEFIDVKVGVHMGPATATENAGDWLGEGFNEAGHFFGSSHMHTGSLRITSPVQKNLRMKLRQIFREAGEFKKHNIFSSDRHFLDPRTNRTVQYIKSSRVLDIQNEDGDTFIQQRVCFANVSTVPISSIEIPVSSSTPLPRKVPDISAYIQDSGSVLPTSIRESDFGRVSWNIEFPSLVPGKLLELNYSVNWPKMFPNKKENWISSVPYPCDEICNKVILPKGLRPRADTVKVVEQEHTRSYIHLDRHELIDANDSVSGRWEIEMKLAAPTAPRNYRLEWTAVIAAAKKKHNN